VDRSVCAKVDTINIKSEIVSLLSVVLGRSGVVHVLRGAG
jgi:hypothetical protein